MTLEVSEGRRTQSTDEQIPYTIDASTAYGAGCAPSNGTAFAYDLTDEYRDVSSTVLQGAVSISGDVITTPVVKSLTAGHLYRVEVQFVTGTKTVEHYFEIRAEKGARSGMSHLIVRLRRMVDDVDGADFTDADLQDVLDAHKVRVHRECLDMEKTLVSADDYEYKIYHSRHDNFEAGGTTYFQIHDGAGSQRGTDDYSVDYINGVVTMGSDQAGTVLYLSGYSYDLHGAAGGVWELRMADVSSYYDVRMDGHQLDRSQWMAHCDRMARTYKRKARARTVRSWREGDFGLG